MTGAILIAMAIVTFIATIVLVVNKVYGIWLVLGAVATPAFFVLGVLLVIDQRDNVRDEVEACLALGGTPDRWGRSGRHVDCYFTTRGSEG